MTNDEIKAEMRQDMLRDACEDDAYENTMRKHEEFAYAELGLQDIVESIENLSSLMAEYGHEVSVKDILGEI